MRKSESIKNIAVALCKFQEEVKNPKNIANNPYFKSKYAPLDEVVNTIKPLLAKNGLSYIQTPGGDGEHITVTTMLMHSSGEWIESDPLVLKADKATAQGAGSAITYARRYSLCAVLGITSEDDDDGNIASGTANAVDKDTDKINAPQAKRLFAIAGKGNEQIVKDILMKHNYYKTEQIKKCDYDIICKEIEDIVKKEAGK